MTNGSREQWDKQRLGDIFEVQQGKALSASARSGPNKLPFLRTRNLLWNRVMIDSVDTMSFTDEEIRRLRLRHGDLLVCEGGDIGRSAVWRDELPDCLYQNHIHRLRAKNSDVDPWFVAYWLRAAFQLFGTYSGAGNRTTIPNLSSSRLKEFEVPLPALHEQQAIRKTLETIEQASITQNATVTALKDLKAAVMSNLFRYGTRGVATTNTECGVIPETWAVVPVGSVFHIQLGKMLSEKARTGVDEKPYIRNVNVRWGDFDLRSVYKMHFSAAERRKFALAPGDVLVCEGGEPGRAAIWSGDVSECYYQKALHRLRPTTNKVLPKFYVYWSEAAFKVLRSHDFSGAKTTIAHLPAAKLATMKMVLPPLDEQLEIVETCDAVHKALRHEMKASELLSTLFDSALSAIMGGPNLADGYVGPSN